MGIIEFKNVSFEYARYDEERRVSSTCRALRDVSFSVPRGEFLAVLGHNGSGKSTAAKLINALLTPKTGQVFVNGLDTSVAGNIYEVRKSAGMVFQNPDNQIIANIVEEDVAFGPENLALPPAEIRERVDFALEAVGLRDFADSPPHFLSGGQKQRVAIAGVLAMEPEILVLDEPTAMLDPVGRREVISAVTRLNKERNITVVLITHFMDEAVRADRVLVMDDGRIAMEGSPSEVFSSVERLAELRLDAPQVSELAHILKKAGVPLPGGILTTSEMVMELCALRARFASGLRSLGRDGAPEVR
ncbi:MAG: energy-coupling factor transporter ATPase [Clostridiales bacterium]|jgi:energy-coupling factor transport system ATP-binding protein|nr:energy-coupling factor transporter ATPase [Clostridiales bacterium]